MSSDNGVYIGRFRDSKRNYSYRVIHAQSIENCDFNPNFPDYFTKANIVLYYGKSQAFTELSRAWEEAHKKYNEIMEDDYGVCEYGVSQINYDIPFPNLTVLEAAHIIDEYWERVETEIEFNFSPKI